MSLRDRLDRLERDAGPDPGGELPAVAILPDNGRGPPPGRASSILILPAGHPWWVSRDRADLAEYGVGPHTEIIAPQPWVGHLD